MIQCRGRIHSFESFGTVDGPGVRYIVFFQGCPLRCRYCHNPDTWTFSAGNEYTVEEIMQKINSCRNFLSGGVTLSGGEPLAQGEFALALLNACRNAGFHTALDTAGSLPLDVSAPVIDAADMLLLDIKALDSDLCKSLTGQGNSHELAVLDYCEKKSKRVWIRHVLVPGITLKMNLLQDLRHFLEPYRCVERVELLPFHKMGASKWEKLNIPFELKDTPLPARDEIMEAEAVFKNFHV